MTVPKLLLPVLMIAAVLGAVLVGQVTETWNVSGKTMIDVNSLTSTEDIKGWMTIQQISTGFNIDLPTLYAITGLSSEIAPETALKDLENIVEGFEITLVREKIAAYLETGQIPATEGSSTTGGASAPEAAPEPTPTQAPAPELSVTAHVPGQTGEVTGEGTGPTPLPAGTYLAAVDIKGRTTLKEIIQNGLVDKDALLQALALPADINLNITAKDLVGQGTITEIQIIRDVVAELQSR